jgi:hypothetical protein
VVRVRGGGERQVSQDGTARARTLGGVPAFRK